jgi:hypothetical protein
MSREIMQQALDKFEHLWEIGIDAEYKVDLMPEIRALREELAKPEQEPVSHLWECLGRWSAYLAANGKQGNLAPPTWLVDAVKAATAPPRKPEPVQVTPHEFIAMASKQANMVGTPVVWAEYPTPNKIILDEGWEWRHETEVAKPEREWVGLTDDEVDLILWQGVFDAKDIRTIEAKLKEKNHGSV